MHSRKIKFFILFLIFFPFITEGSYVDGLISEGVFVNEDFVDIGEPLHFNQLKLAALKHIFKINNNYLVIGIKGLIILDTKGNIIKKRYLSKNHFINESYTENGNIYLFIDHKLYKCDCNDLIFHNLSHRPIKDYYWYNGVIKRYNKEIFYNKDKKYFSINKKYFYFPQTIEKLFVFGSRIFFIDINGDVYLEKVKILSGKHIKFIKKEKENYYFFGDGIYDIKGNLIQHDISPLEGYIYKVFDYYRFYSKEGIYISTYDQGVILHTVCGDSETVYPYKLLSGIYNNILFFKNGEIIDKNQKITLNDEILSVNNHFIFGRNGIYDLNDRQPILIRKDFYFSSINIKEHLVGSYKQGLFLLKDRTLKHIKTPFRGVKDIITFNKNLYIIANNGIYKMKNNHFIKVFKGPILHYLIKNNRLYFSVFHRGIFMFNGKKIINTSLSKHNLNAYFLDSIIVLEIFHHIYFLNYEIL